MPVIKCDIIICGGGLSGLSLLYRAMKSGTWKKERIIVVDRSDKQENDKTWSFWKIGDSDFEEVIHHQWKDLVFFTNEGERIPLKNGGYTYNSIRSIDFYHYVHQNLKAFTNISFVKEEIFEVTSVPGGCELITDAHTYQSTWLFNSIYKKPDLKKGEQYFLQHFKGLRIRTKSAIPPLSEAWLMDFRTDQHNGTTFFYTLPMADNEVLVEYTLFSKSLLSPDTYNQKIGVYLNNVLKIDSYEILEEEFGVIPMTDHVFKRFDGNIINIGSAGGDTRGSTGYTFVNIQKTINQILIVFQSAGHPFFKEETIGVKAQLYDATLLRVLAKKKYSGHHLFTDLFSKTPAYLIFAFLDAETSLYQDMYLMKSLRAFPFLQSFAVAVYKRFFSSKG